MENTKYLIWLALGFSRGSSKLGRLLRTDPAEEIYLRRDELKRHYPFLSEKDCEKLSKLPLSRAEMVIEQCQRLGIGILPIDSPMYPELLRQIDSPPPVLYYKGLLPDFNNSISVAMVGTRDAEDYYLSITGNLSYQLAKAGVIVVSGCAVGIDRYAHTGALKAGGFTVGVMAVGLDIDYPIQNRDLRDEITKRGLLLSELPPGTQVKSDYFHTRNRLISGLCHGTVITQAPLRSGSLLTADHAVEQNRDLFCVPPNNIYDPVCMGSARLLREGAKLVFSAYDILEEYHTTYPDRIKAEMVLQGELMLKPDGGREFSSGAARKAASGEKKKPAEQPKLKEEAKETLPAEPKEAPPGLSKNQKTVYDLLAEGACHVDEILQRCEIPSYAVLSCLTEMELLGIIEAMSGQRYRIL